MKQKNKNLRILGRVYMFKNNYKFSFIVTNEDYIVRDHRLHDVRAIPGVTFLDIIFRFAKSKGFDTSRIAVKNFLFLQPVITSEEYDKRVVVNMKREEGTDFWKFEVKSQKYKDGKSLDDEWFTNSRGEMHQCDYTMDKRIDVAQLKRKAGKKYDMDKAYEYSRRGNLCHYEFMKLLGDVYVSDEFLLGELHLSKLAEAYLDYFELHPAYLDGCLSVTAILVSDNPAINMDEAKPFIPIYIESFTACASFGKKIYVYIKMDEIDVAKTEDVMYMNLELYDETGKQIAYYNHFSAKRVRNDNIVKVRDGGSKTETQKPQLSVVARETGLDTGKSLKERIEEELNTMICSALGKEAEQIAKDTEFYDFGLESTQLMKMVSDLENKLSITLYPTLMFEFNTISKLSDYLLDEYKKECEAVFGADTQKNTQSVQQVHKESQASQETKKEQVSQIPENNSSEDLKDTVTRILVEIMATYLNTEAAQIDIDMNFYDMGLESTTLLEIAKSLEEKFQVNLYPTLMFEYDTINKLSDYFVAEYSEKVRPFQSQGTGRQNDDVLEIEEVDMEEEESEEADCNMDFCYVTKWKKTRVVKEKLSSQNEKRVLYLYTKDAKKIVTNLIKYHKEDAKTILLGKMTKEISDSECEINILDEDALYQAMSAMDDVEKICFVTMAKENRVDMNTVNDAQEKGVITLYRVIRKITDKKSFNNLKKLCIVTNNVYQVTQQEEVMPLYSAIAGFYKSMVKEYPHIQMNYFDLSKEDISKKYKDMITDVFEIMDSEESDKSGIEVAIRNGSRYVKKIQYLNLPEVKKPVFRENGTYMILGGAGGIGTELGKYMSKHAKANVALVGRRGINEDIEEKMNQISQYGGRAIYVQADAENEEELKAAVKKINDTFGPIHGVVHSAIVLKDKLIQMMPEQTLRDVLAPKVYGSVSLHHAVEDQPLDFVLFFSSAQSYIGNVGQANYAGSCTFKDAYASYMRAQGFENVSVINWGYWGSVGIVATKEHNERLAKNGSQSIMPEEGMETVVRTLGNRMDQVIAMKVEDYVLEAIHVRKEEEEKLYPDVIPTMDKNVLAELERNTENVNFSNDEEHFEEFVKFGNLMVLGKFKSMGVFNKAGETMNKYELMKTLDIDPQYDKMYSALLFIMQEAGYLEIENNTLTTTKMVELPEILKQLESMEEYKDRLMKEYPDIDAHINLIWVCVNAYDKVLTGKENYMSVMFPKGSMSLVEKIYRGNEITDYFNKMVAKVSSVYVKNRVSQDSNAHVDILEIGAGTGGTSTFVLQDLDAYKKHVSYMYTDKSLQFCLTNAKAFGKKYSFMKYGSLDIEENPLTQNYKEGQYDFIFASNVLHATQSIEVTLTNAKKLLKKNGLIVINEATAFQSFTTLTFGITSGWWRYCDEDVRIKHAPLLSQEQWRSVLEKNGFRNISFIGLPNIESEKSGQHIIIAQSDGFVELPKKKERYSAQDTIDGKVELIDVYANADEKRFLSFWEECRKNNSYEREGKEIDFVAERAKIPYSELMHVLVTISEGTKMEAVIAGKGEPILFISGFGFTAPQWKKQFEFLADRCTCICVNIPGIGLSGDIEDFTYDGISEALMKTLDILKITGKINVVASSWAGIIGQNLAKKFPDRICKLILTGAFSELVQKDEQLTLRERVRQDCINLGKEDYYDVLINSEASNLRIVPKYSIYARENFSTEKISPFVKAETLIIHGAKDMVVPEEESTILEQRITNARKVVIEDAGHVPNMTNAEEFNRLLCSFIFQ